MSADTEEVTPPPDVTLGEEPQSEVQSLITLWSYRSMEPPLPFRRRRPGSTGNMRSVSLITPPSFKEQPVRRSSKSLPSLNMDSPERFGASMRSIRSMEPPTSFSFDFHRSNDSINQPLSVSGWQRPRSSRSLWSSLNVESPERLSASASMRSIRSRETPTSFRAELETS